MGRSIVGTWFSLAVLLAVATVWTFSNMGDCPEDMTCVRPSWFEALIVGGGIGFWLLGLRLILRRRRKEN